MKRGVYYYDYNTYWLDVQNWHLSSLSFELISWWRNTHLISKEMKLEIVLGHRCEKKEKGS